MKIASLRLELYIPGAESLKDKRSVIKSLIQKCSNKYNISISEVGELDTWRRSVIAVAMISNDYSLIEKSFQKIINYIDTIYEIELMNHDIEYL
ncbi:DUF503 domain-containing protein [Natronospora cellulosivora (SeqCode)]